MDMKPQKLNEAALALIRKTLPSPPALTLANFAAEMIQIKNEVNEELKKQAKIMRKIAQKGDDRMNVVKKRIKTELIPLEDIEHDVFIAKLREVQPELKKIEFSIDIQNGTYTPLSLRDTEEEEDDNPTKALVQELLKRIALKGK